MSENTEISREEVKKTVEQFVNDLDFSVWEPGKKGPSITCDSSNNTPESIARGELNITLHLPYETITQTSLEALGRVRQAFAGQYITEMLVTAIQQAIKSEIQQLSPELVVDASATTIESLKLDEWFATVSYLDTNNRPVIFDAALKFPSVKVRS